MATAPTTQPHEADEHTLPPFLRRVRIRGYKSIGRCDVRLEPATILVGRNAAGKSNFLDALAFLRDVMALGVTEAVKRRGGWSRIACRTSRVPAIELEIETGPICGRLCPPAGRNGPAPGDRREQEVEVARATYSLKLSPTAFSVPRIERESLEITATSGQVLARFSMSDGVIEQPEFAKPDWLTMIPEARHVLTAHDYPLLGVIGAQPVKDLWAGVRHMAFYNFIPEAMRQVQPPTPGQLLDRNGWNLAGVIASLKEIDPRSFERAQGYLSAIVEEVEHFDVVRYGEYETIRFRLRSGTSGAPVEFDAASMSDGTLRVLATIIASFQTVAPYGCPSVIGIEEPETALHPAAAGALVAALDEATAHSQVIVTTHSADLLENRDLAPGQVLVVRSRGGQTAIAPVDPASREILQKELYTLADLHRMDHLEPDAEDLDRQARTGDKEE